MEDAITTIADMLKKQVVDKKYVDVGSGVETHFGTSKEKLRAAVVMLKEEDYKVRIFKIRQDGTGLESRVKLLTPPDFDLDNFHQIAQALFKE